jgi:hypothetical protein
VQLQRRAASNEVARTNNQQYESDRERRENERLEVSIAGRELQLREFHDAERQRF